MNDTTTAIYGIYCVILGFIIGRYSRQINRSFFRRLRNQTTKTKPTIITAATATAYTTLLILNTTAQTVTVPVYIPPGGAGYFLDTDSFQNYYDFSNTGPWIPLAPGFQTIVFQDTTGASGNFPEILIAAFPFSDLSTFYNGPNWIDISGYSPQVTADFMIDGIETYRPDYPGSWLDIGISLTGQTTLLSASDLTTTYAGSTNTPEDTTITTLSQTLNYAQTLLVPIAIAIIGFCAAIGITKRATKPTGVKP